MSATTDELTTELRYEIERARVSLERATQLADDLSLATDGADGQAAGNVGSQVETADGALGEALEELGWIDGEEG